MHWYIEVLKKYAVFTGRARRKEYWILFLFQVLISFVIGLIEGITNTNVLGMLFLLLTLLPSIALSVRRLHDIGKSGWWMLIGLIPLIGSIVLLVFACLDSQPGENTYGPNPKF